MALQKRQDFDPLYSLKKILSPFFTVACLFFIVQWSFWYLSNGKNQALFLKILNLSDLAPLGGYIAYNVLQIEYPMLDAVRV